MLKVPKKLVSGPWVEIIFLTQPHCSFGQLSVMYWVPCSRTLDWWLLIMRVPAALGIQQLVPGEVSLSKTVNPSQPQICVFMYSLPFLKKYTVSGLLLVAGTASAALMLPVRPGNSEARGLGYPGSITMFPSRRQYWSPWSSGWGGEMVTKRMTTCTAL